MTSDDEIPKDVMKTAIAMTPGGTMLANLESVRDVVCRAIMVERERLRGVIHDLYIEVVWDAFNAGIVRDGRWMDGAMSDAEHLRMDLGLEDGWHDALAVQAMLPALARSKTDEAIRATP